MLEDQSLPLVIDMPSLSKIVSMPHLPDVEGNSSYVVISFPSLASVLDVPSIHDAVKPLLTASVHNQVSAVSAPVVDDFPDTAAGCLLSLQNA